MDPLSEVLSLMRLETYGCNAVDVSGGLCLDIPAYEGVKYYAVIKGDGWLAVEGAPAPVHLHAGDCLILLRGKPFRMATDLALPPVDPGVQAWPAEGGVVRINGGGERLILAGHFALQGHHAARLLDALPPVVHLAADADKALLRWSVERLAGELLSPRPGTSLIAGHLAHMILLQAIRLHIADAPEGRTGWLYALADKALGPAIGLVHDDPGHGWTVDGLARRVGMSRSAFAARFRTVVGVSPMAYVAQWRMALAADRLAASREPVAVISERLGYGSESAFSTAFKRVTGTTPRDYRRSRCAEAIAAHPK